jgi:hypothetical protein
VGEVMTIHGARTIARDPKTHHIFSIATEQSETLAGDTTKSKSAALVEIGK